MKIQEYELCQAPSSGELTIEVNNFLVCGWQLYGLPSVAICSTGAILIQAVVREVEQPGAWG
jgi:hypothetical protein